MKAYLVMFCTGSEFTGDWRLPQVASTDKTVADLIAIDMEEEYKKHKQYDADNYFAVDEVEVVDSYTPNDIAHLMKELMD